MVDIKELLENINRKSLIMGRDEFHLLFRLLTKYFNCRMRGMYFSFKNSNYPMCFELDRGVVCTNYNALVDYYTNYVLKRVGKVDPVLVNYYLAFGVIHEFVHSEQYDSNATDLSDVDTLYQLCFAYVSDGNHSLKRVLNNVLYQRLHDYFATEINANIRAYESILGLVRDEYRDYFMRELYLYVNMCYRDFDLYGMYRDSLKLKEIEDLNFDLSIEHKVRNGVYLSRDERKLVLSGREIKLNHVIDCN